MSAATAVLSDQEAATRLRFVWGTPVDVPGPLRFGLVCAYRKSRQQTAAESASPKIKTRKRPPLTLVVSIRGLLAWALAVALLVHLGIAACLYSRYRPTPNNLVTYADLVLPWRWADVPVVRARSRLMQAKEDVREGRYAPAFDGLRLGLSRYPQDADARLQLALFYVASFRRDRADALLFEGLDYGDPGLGFLRDAIAFLKDSDRPDQLLGFTVKACAAVADPSPDRSAKLRLLAATGADALLALRRHQEAVALIESLSPPDPEIAGRIRMVAALETSRPAAAVAACVEVYRRTGRIEEMEQALVRLRRLNPANPGFASLAVVQNLLAGRDDAACAAMEDLVYRFGGYPQVLDSLAREKTLAPDVQVFQKTAAAVIEPCARGTPAARLVLLDLFSRYRGRLKLFASTVDWLVEAGHWPAAGDVLALAERGFPQSRQPVELRQRVAPELARIASEEAEQNRLAQVARVAAAGDTFAGADDFLAALDNEQARGTSVIADLLIREVLRRKLNHALARELVKAWAGPEPKKPS
jgi:tetratricopeptide (TPR) repeat protein